MTRITPGPRPDRGATPHAIRPGATARGSRFLGFSALVLLASTLAGCLTRDERAGYRVYEASWREGLEDTGRDPVVLSGGDVLELCSVPPSTMKSRVVCGTQLTLHVRAPGSRQASTYPLPRAPDGRERLGAILGELASHVAGVYLVDVGDSDCASLVLYDVEHRRIAFTETPWPGNRPAPGARDGDLWVSVPAADSRPDPNRSRPLPRMGLSTEPVNQRLYRLDTSLTPVPTEHVIPCRSGQLHADRKRALLYSTTWESRAVQERDADGRLLRSWDAPNELKQINALDEGFGDFEVVVRGCKVGLELFSHVDLVYGLDTDTGRWEKLDSGSTGIWQII